ncbi:MAG: NAD(+)/NADH kinase [Acidobacteriota bacterium]|nr:NAD(+)/NADH kinase [Acidobacteriota bacterium]
MNASPVREVTVLTHSAPAQTREAVGQLIEHARAAGVLLRFDERESARHGLSPQDGVLLNAPISPDVGLCVVLGGDGTILRALHHYGGTGVPVFAVNFGEVGFLATVTKEEAAAGFRRALSGDFELLRLPAIVVEAGGVLQRAINDVAVHRKAGGRVARLAYALDGDELGSVRCDGLVVATPAGSTGYNLANGGPVMAWGVEGFVISFIAPHSLTARALVAAPADDLTICNRSRDLLEVTVDGRPVGELAAGEELRVTFEDDVGVIAQLPGYSFYGRLREKFGLLAR